MLSPHQLHRWAHAISAELAASVHGHTGAASSTGATGSRLLTPMTASEIVCVCWCLGSRARRSMQRRKSIVLGSKWQRIMFLVTFPEERHTDHRDPCHIHERYSNHDSRNILIRERHRSAFDEIHATFMRRGLRQSCRG